MWLKTSEGCRPGLYTWCWHEKLQIETNHKIWDTMQLPWNVRHNVKPKTLWLIVILCPLLYCTGFFICWCSGLLWWPNCWTPFDLRVIQLYYQMSRKSRLPVPTLLWQCICFCCDTASLWWCLKFLLSWPIISNLMTPRSWYPAHDNWSMIDWSWLSQSPQNMCCTHFILPGTSSWEIIIICYTILHTC